MSTTKKRVAVTGINGKVGQHVVDQLLEHGHEVFGIDQTPAKRTDIISIVADLTDYGQTFDALGSVGWDVLGDTVDNAFDVVVHLAAVPHPRLYSNAKTFENNVVAGYNVFEAAHRHGLKDIVLASSETVLGVPFPADLDHLPLDDDSARHGRNAYGLSKLIMEHLAEEYTSNDPELRVTALRLSYVQNVDEYDEYPSFADNLDTRAWDIWSYIDGRDVGTATEKALHQTERGFHPYLIVADDTVMPIPTAKIIAERYPNTAVTGELAEFGSLLSNAAAKRDLGWAPEHSWRDRVEPDRC
ncbi:NAD(P)-dependent oxidoreductase [Curtobacterium sp. ODYSSEY 48 V2]|uniref:NAD-dependent epimerase/dehydratase family protein n=1 Tax=Curtobacterium sp. ODYSSEY 48 V2 TaxID=2939561 RepID=UPI00203CAFBD|nr:NAD(P)-dependent oxidoreductase [Curtobacterium sp. ODYSSEY 48 V2]MCM3503823.1 NAD(P)-dependent oxidoreductase [Curtobacterium sp. ODYSSEY 48 V2]